MIMIDFHTHVLPGIDDGAKNTEESLKLLEICSRQGIEAIAATPHFYPMKETPQEFCKRRENAYNKLLPFLGEKQFPDIMLGAEVFYFEGMSDYGELECLKISGTKAILIEMPFIPWTLRMTSDVGRIYEKRGIIPLIAHIDRYINIFGKKEVLRCIDGLPVLIQANASFFIRKKTMGTALSMLKKDMIHLLGSDFHNLASRQPNLRDAADIIVKHGRSSVEKIYRHEQGILVEP